MPFTVSHSDPNTAARAGILRLPRRDLPTPAFLPVGTNATVKAMTNEDLEGLGVGMILCNTYHLYLRPGIEVIESCGGLHRFMGWRNNILTDSGGFQVFSLAPLRTLNDEGVRFRSHLDGSLRTLSPEEVVELQLRMGSDVMMPLDVCTPPEPGVSREQAEEAVRLTTLWARRSRDCWLSRQDRGGGLLFGIVQGNLFTDLRARSAEEIVSLDLPGYAIGGLSVGEPFSRFQEILSLTAPKLPGTLPRYLMGIGTPELILEAVENGIDLFDCVFPTRTARNALVFTDRGTLNLRNEANRMAEEPIERDCSCSTCRSYSRAYLRHLFKAKEILAAILATRHNLHFLHNFVQKIRAAILESRFPEFKRGFLDAFATSRREHGLRV